MPAAVARGRATQAAADNALSAGVTTAGVERPASIRSRAPLTIGGGRTFASSEANAVREAQRLAANYNRGREASKSITAAQILSKTGGLFERHILKISASEASFGSANVVFRTPLVAAPR